MTSGLQEGAPSPVPLGEHPAVRVVVRFGQFYVVVARRAIRESVGFFSLSKRGVVGALVLGIISLLLSMWLMPQALEADAPKRLIAFMALAVFGVFLLVANFVRAPFLLDSERQEAIEALRAELAAERLQRAVSVAAEERDKRLKELYNVGSRIRIDIRESTDDVSPSILQERLQLWAMDVARCVSETVSRGKAHYVVSIETVPLMDIAGIKSDKTREEKTKLLLVAQEMLKRLRETMAEL